MAVNGGASGHVQFVKLVDGTANGTDGLPGTAARGLAVDPRPKITRVAVNSAGLTTASTAYVTGDQLGTILEFTNAVRASGGSAMLLSGTLLDKAKVISGVDLYLFDRSVTLASDNAAADFSDSDMENCLGVVEFPYPKQHGSNYFATAPNIGLEVVSNATSIFGALVTRSGHTFFGAATDLRVSLTFSQD